MHAYNGLGSATEERLAQLLRASADGDRSAYEAFVVEIHRELRVFIAQRSLCVTMTDEVLQATLVRAFFALARYDSRRSATAWVKGIARNVLREELRRMPRGSVDAHRALQDVVARQQLGALEDEGVNEEAQALRECLHGLDPEVRRLLDMRYRDGQPVAGIARGTRRTEAAIAGVLRRARAALRRCLRRKGVKP
ncbi:MAG: RNA polymerase sigma factor [Planctomycetota bacterium]